MRNSPKRLRIRVLVQQDGFGCEVLPMPHSAVHEVVPFNFELTKDLFDLLQNLLDNLPHSCKLKVIHMLCHESNKLRPTGLHLMLHA